MNILEVIEIKHKLYTEIDQLDIGNIIVCWHSNIDLDPDISLYVDFTSPTYIYNYKGLNVSVDTTIDQTVANKILDQILDIEG